MKMGANFVDRNAIQRMAKAGYGIEDISMKLHIHKVVVKNFFPDAEVEEDDDDDPGLDQLDDE